MPSEAKPIEVLIGGYYHRYSESEFECERKGASLIAEMLRAILQSHGARVVNYTYIQNLLSIAIHPGKGVRTRGEALRRLGVAAPIIQKFEKRIETFIQNYDWDLSSIGPGAIMPVSFKIQKEKSRDWPFLAATGKLLQGLSTKTSSSIDARKVFESAYADIDDFPEGVSARSLCPILYALRPDVFPLVNSWVSEGMQAILGHDAKSLMDYRKAIYTLPDFLNRANLPAHFGALDRILSLLRNRGIRLPKQPGETDGDVEQDLEEIKKNQKLTATTKMQLIDARLGQGRFRKQLMNLWKGQCALSGCSVSEVLQASHIKPWRASTNLERLDPYNGLLLTANLHALFDTHLISFDMQGSLKVSKRVDRGQLRLLNLRGRLRTPLNSSQKKYLVHHLREWTRSP